MRRSGEPRDGAPGVSRLSESATGRDRRPVMPAGMAGAEGRWHRPRSQCNRVGKSKLENSKIVETKDVIE
jgi:hypothetical protein